MPTPKACERCGATFESSPGLEGLCAACLFKASLEPEIVVTRGAERRPAPAIAALAPHFPDLEILEQIGHGGMGAVYRVRQKSLGRDAALKVLALDGESDPAFGERFEREARLLASLAHPNIVSVYGAGRAGPHWYLLMELVEGASLRQMIAAHELDPRSALAIVGQVCDALQAAHDRGVVHRDIKPENVIVTRKGTAKILDFGLAKLVGQGPRTANTLTETGQVMGTVRYMAPEQWDRPLAVDHRADIYSLGVVMYELLTGELPMGRFPLPSTKAQVGANVDNIVLKTLEKEPAQRYQHASDVRADVDRAAQTTQEHATVREGLAARGDELRAALKWRAPLFRVFGWAVLFATLGLIFAGVLLVLTGQLGAVEMLLLALLALTPLAIAAIAVFFMRRGTDASAPHSGIPPSSSASPSERLPVSAEPEPFARGFLRAFAWIAAATLAGSTLLAGVLTIAFTDVELSGARPLVMVLGSLLVPMSIAVAIVVALRRGTGSRSPGRLAALGCVGVVVGAIALFGSLALWRFVGVSKYAAQMRAESERAQHEARAAREASIAAELTSMPPLAAGEFSSTELRDDGRGRRRGSYSGVAKREELLKLAPFARIVPGSTPEVAARARWATIVWALHASQLNVANLRDKQTTADDVVTYRIPAMTDHFVMLRRLAMYLLLHLDDLKSAGSPDSEDFRLLLPAGRAVASAGLLYWRFDLPLVEAELASLADKSAFDERFEKAIEDLNFGPQMGFGGVEWLVEIRGAHSATPSARITLPDGAVREIDTPTLLSLYGLLLHLAR